MLTLKQNQKPIAIIKGGKLNNKIIYYESEIGKEKKPIKELTLDKDEKFFPVPKIDKDQTDAYLIGGPRGSGKTTFCMQYLDYFHKLYPSYEIYFFSNISDEDRELPLFKDKPFVKIIPIDEEIKEIELEELKDSLCVFDDIDRNRNKSILDAIRELRDKVLEEGRNYNVYCLSTMHQMLGYRATRFTLLESDNIVIFPKSGCVKMIRDVLDKYGGLDKKVINNILKCNSRWAIFHKTVPLYVLTENNLYLL